MFRTSIKSKRAETLSDFSSLPSLVRCHFQNVPRRCYAHCQHIRYPRVEDVKLNQGLLGHRSITSTMEYVGTSNGQAAEAAQAAFMRMFQPALPVKCNITHI